MELEDNYKDPVFALRNLYPQISNPKPREKRRMFTNYLVQKYNDKTVTKSRKKASISSMQQRDSKSGSMHQNSKCSTNPLELLKALRPEDNYFIQEQSSIIFADNRNIYVYDPSIAEKDKERK